MLNSSSDGVTPLSVQGFDLNEDISTINVLRYLPLDRFLSLLELEAMWFSRLGALQDRFECTNPQGARAFVLNLENDPDAVEQCKSLGLWEHMKASAENGSSGDEGRFMFLVNCWFIGSLETAKMWSDYGDQGKGIAIRSTVLQLASSFHIPGGFRQVSKVGRIKYADFKSYVCADDITEKAFIKDQRQYKDENEVRILTPNYFHSGCLTPDGIQSGWPQSGQYHPQIKGFFIRCNLTEMIKSVIVGPNNHSNFRMLMKRIVARYSLNIDVEQSQIGPIQ